MEPAVVIPICIAAVILFVTAAVFNAANGRPLVRSRQQRRVDKANADLLVAQAKKKKVQEELEALILESLKHDWTKDRLTVTYSNKSGDYIPFTFTNGSAYNLVQKNVTG